MKTCILLIFMSAFCLLNGCMSESKLGPLANFWHDCSAHHSSNKRYAYDTLRRALSGDYAALHAVFFDPIVYDTGDNEAYAELPEMLLKALGDDYYVTFVLSQPGKVQARALGFFYPDQVLELLKKYPKTMRLCTPPFHPKGVQNQALHPTAHAAFFSTVSMAKHSTYCDLPLPGSG